MRIGSDNWLRPFSSKATVHGPLGRRTCRHRPRSATPAGGNVLHSFCPTSKTPTRWLPRSHGANWRAPLTRPWTLRDRGSMRRQLRAGWTIQSSPHATPPTLSCLALSAVRPMPRGSNSASKPHGSSHDATNLAAMIGADLELRGPSRVDWVEATYFADRSRTMPEIEAALLALNVHGDANRTVPRERVIQAYRAFIRERPPMAGFVAAAIGRLGLLGRRDGIHGAPQVQHDQGSGLGICRRQLSAACRVRQRGCSIVPILTGEPMAPQPLVRLQPTLETPEPALA